MGGIQNRAKNYVENLVRMNNKVIVVHLLDPEVLQTYFGKTPSSENIPVQKYLGATVYRFPSSINRLFKIFFTTTISARDFKSDAIHLISGANTPIGILYLIYGKAKAIKTGISFYGKDILDSHHVYLLLSRLAMLLTDRIGVNSKATYQLIPRLFRHKVFVLYPGVDVSISKRIEPANALEAKRKILFVGRLVKRKGADDLLRAFRGVVEKFPDVRLTIVGDGPQRESLNLLARKLHVQDRVEFTGTLLGAELYKQYRGCDIFVMPSKKTKTDMEGFGIVFLEAAIFKKPSIGARSGGIPEAIIDRQTGLLTPQGNVEALRDAIEMLLADKHLAKRLGENAYKRVVQKFSWERATLDFLGMYQK